MKHAEHPDRSAEHDAVLTHSLRHWYAQEGSAVPEAFGDPGPRTHWPGGWWIAPAIALSVMLWGMLFWALLT